MSAEHPALRLARMVIDGDELISQARGIISLDSGGRAALLRARRLIESGWPDRDRVPSARDFSLAAQMLADGGRAGQARMLAAMARTQQWLDMAGFSWDQRYAALAGHASVRVLRQVTSGVFDLGPEHRGVDGAVYQAGGYSGGGEQPGEPVVVLRTRASCELVTGWEEPLAAWQWVAGRLPSADGPLCWPPGGAIPRMVREEQVLAFVLRAPWELDAVSEALPWFQFAADVREEVFQAARLIHARGGTVDARSVAAEAASRYEWAPAWARDALGGPGTPSVLRYAARLAATEVSPGLARQAIGDLAQLCAAPDRDSRQRTVSPRHQAVLLDRRPDAVPHVVPRGPAPRM
jgi:hypothetical protein